MKTILRSALPALLLACCASLALQAQVPPPSGEPGSMPEAHAGQGPAKPMPSPPATAEVQLKGKSIVIHYNRPSLRGRVMIGEHDAYDKVWRTGANPATSFITETNLRIGDMNVPAGKYTLYSLPEAPGKPWMLIINKQTGQWGTVYNQAQDLGRTPMQYREMPSSQETMSLSFEKTTPTTTQLHIKWAKSDTWVDIKAE